MKRTISEHILDLLYDSEPMRAGQLVSQISQEAETSEATVRQELVKMLKAGSLEQPKRGYYQLPSMSPDLEGIARRLGSPALVMRIDKSDLDIRMRKWRNGQSLPSVHDLIEIYRRTGVDLHWLLTGEEPDERKPVRRIPETEHPSDEWVNQAIQEELDDVKRELREEWRIVDEQIIDEVTIKGTVVSRRRLVTEVPKEKMEPQQIGIGVKSESVKA